MCVGRYHGGSNVACATARIIPRGCCGQGEYSVTPQYECNAEACCQPYVTELDLRVAHLPASAIEFLRQAMPSSQNDVGEAEYDYERWLDEVFEQQDGR